MSDNETTEIQEPEQSPQSPAAASAALEPNAPVARRFGLPDVRTFGTKDGRGASPRE